MKVRLEDGSYLVAVGMGGTAQAKNLKDAERIEENTATAYIWGLSISAVIYAIGIIMWNYG